MDVDTPWPGSIREYPASPIQPVLPVVVRSPHRYWTSAIWDAELNKGTFDMMSNDDRILLSSTFVSGTEAAAIQAMVRDKEASLQALAYPLDLGLSDRLRYYDILARADSASSLLEVLAAQNIERIDAFGLRLIGHDQDEAAYRAFLAEQNARAVNVYGDCVVPMAFAFLSNGDED